MSTIVIAPNKETFDAFVNQAMRKTVRNALSYRYVFRNDQFQGTEEPSFEIVIVNASACNPSVVQKAQMLESTKHIPLSYIKV
jgi:hypothetical protein